MPGISGICRLAWSVSSADRVILIRDQIVTKVSGNVLGNPLTPVVAGTGSRVWMPTSGVPCPVRLAFQGAACAVMPQEVTFRPLDGS
jgi:hypothetical protein